MTIYDVGDLVRCSATFTDQDDTAVDPTGIAFKVKTPAGVTTTYTYGTDAALVRDSTGNYHVDVSMTAAGLWPYRWASTGTGQAAAEGQLLVEASRF
jgi:hypothetical protein